MSADTHSQSTPRSRGRIDSRRPAPFATGALKPTLLLPPVAAVLAVSLWIANERRTIATLETQTTMLRERIAARVAGSGPDQASTLAGASGKSTKEKEPIDWKKTAEQIIEMNQSGGMGDMRAMIRLQQRIQEMSRNELVAALDEIAAADLTDDARAVLEQMLAGPLCQKDPQYALTRFTDRMDERGGMNSWMLSNAMKEWAIKDATAATAWFDRQIADGKFEAKSLDGKSQQRMQFEGVLISSLLSSDPAAAGDRLTGLPEDQRAEILKNRTANYIKEEDQAAFATLVRGQLSENEQLETLAQVASQNAGADGFEKVDAYLDRIQATPAERAASVNSSMASKADQISRKNKITREDIDGLREWAATQSPDSVDKATGTAIARAMNSGGSDHQLQFSEAADLASRYHTSSGNDDVIVEFFDQSWQARQHKEEAIKLAEKISDPARREEVLKKFN